MQANVLHHKLCNNDFHSLLDTSTSREGDAGCSAGAICALFNWWYKVMKPDAREGKNSRRVHNEGRNLRERMEDSSDRKDVGIGLRLMYR
jgi:hypothetical protein